MYGFSPGRTWPNDVGGDLLYCNGHQSWFRGTTTWNNHYTWMSWVSFIYYFDICLALENKRLINVWSILHCCTDDKFAVLYFLTLNVPGKNLYHTRAQVWLEKGCRFQKFKTCLDGNYVRVSLCFWKNKILQCRDGHECCGLHVTTLPTRKFTI